MLTARDDLANGEYARAAASLRRMVESTPGLTRSRSLTTAIRKLYAWSLFAQRRDDGTALARCREQIAVLLREDPLAQLDASLYEEGYRRLFDEVRDELRDELARITSQRAVERRRVEVERAARRAEVTRLLTSETVIERSPQRSITLLPFGVGQFINGNERAGWGLLAAELTLAVTCISATSAYVALLQANDNTVVAGSARGNAIEATYWTSILSGGLLAATALTGSLQAFAAWRPERAVTRPRPLPSSLQGVQISVYPMPLQGGAGALLGGRF